MVPSNSTARLSTLKQRVILSQTDTTVGFLSQNSRVLQTVKSRPSSKPFICVFQNLHTLKNSRIRIPSTRKKLLRRAKKTTFIVKNQAFRVASYPLHSQILRSLQWSYSTSANKSGASFQKEFCEEKADIIIEDAKGLFEGKPSTLYKITNFKIKRLR
jgi:tRNA A37 threonylcarbamoyladenosine synthetase subunit TsaC/SUA5/YrdC